MKLERGPQGQKVFRYTEAEASVGNRSFMAEAPEPYRFNDGSDWYQLGPMNQEPWKMPFPGGGIAPPTQIDEQFTALFGERPQMRGGNRFPVSAYDNARKDFVQVGYPINPVDVQSRHSDEAFGVVDMLEADILCREFGLGTPHFYESARGGWRVVFPEGEFAGLFAEAGQTPFSTDADSLLYDNTADGTADRIHVVIARYQVKGLKLGGVPVKRHHFLRFFNSKRSNA